MSTTQIAIAVTMLLVVGAFLGGLYWMNHAPVSADRPGIPARTGFAALREGDAWKLTWDSAAVEALRPSGATLSIQDGDNKKQIPLTTAELASQTVYYRPQSGDLQFRLEVLRGLATVAEASVRMMEPLKPAPAVLAPLAIPPATAEPVREILPAPRRPARLFAPPKSNPARPKETPILAKLTESETEQPAPLAPLLLGFNAPPAPVVPSPPVAEPVAEPVAPTPTASAGAVSSSLYDYVAPKVRKRLQPLVEQGARRNGAVIVQVLVDIDANGKVIKAMPVGPIPDVRLTLPATKAAQFWEFEPARLNGQAVASEMTLVFRF